MGFIIPAAASILGGLLSHKSSRDAAQDKNELLVKQQAEQDRRDQEAQRARYDMGRNTFERNAQGQAVRGGVGGDLLSHWMSIDPKLSQQIRTPTQYPEFAFQPGAALGGEQPIPGNAGFLGGVLSGIAPYLAPDQSPQSVFERYMQSHPATAAQMQGQTYGPPEGPVGTIDPGSDIKPWDLDPRVPKPSGALGSALPEPYY